MRFLPRRRLSRTDRCQSDGKSKKEQCGGMSLRLHDCLRDVDYLLYLFGRAFITLTRPSPPPLSPPFPHPPPTLSRSLSFDRTKARRAYEQTGSQITIDPYALRLREASPPSERFLLALLNSWHSRANACSRHRKYSPDTRLSLPPELDNRYSIHAYMRKSNV